MSDGIKWQYLPHEYERMKDRLRDLESFALVVVNNCSVTQAEIPDRPDLFEWLTQKYQHQQDAFFAEIEELEMLVGSLQNRVNHDPKL